MKQYRFFFLLVCVGLFHNLSGQIKNPNPALPVLKTKWSEHVNSQIPLSDYPRPQMRRDNWQCLNGLWDYAILKDSTDSKPTKFDGKILVPFPIESALSGVEKRILPQEILWYSKYFEVEHFAKGKRVLLHFGAIDWSASVYVNGKLAGEHSGGYTSFSFDITQLLRDGKNELSVKVKDPTDRGIGPHGKQVLTPGNIYYTPSSGIWQTVWIETVSDTYVTDLKIDPNVDKGILQVTVGSSLPSTIEILALDEGKVVSRTKGRTGDILTLPIKNTKTWSPERPFLYSLVVKLRRGAKIDDVVESYFGMRKISIQKDEKGIDRIYLNNKAYFNIGVLDQGFWPDGLYTAPSDSALRFDIEVIKSLGFNTIRKHIKVEPARWYYYADKLGVLVWQDFVNPNQTLPLGSKGQYEKELKEAFFQLRNYPCITSWVVFNERWGAYDQKRLTEQVKMLDPSRLVNGHSGELLYVDNVLRDLSDSPYISSDFVDVHSYPAPRAVPNTAGKVSVLGEFGGISVQVPGHIWNEFSEGWGYNGMRTLADLKRQYSLMIDTLVKLKENGLSGAIYTQPFDVESEQNGLLTYDRAFSKLPTSFFWSENIKLQDQRNMAHSASIEIVHPVDPNDVNIDYQRRRFMEGERDSGFLRRLSVLAMSHNDTSLARIVSSTYFNGLKAPMSIENLRYISKFTTSTGDPGFAFVIQNLKPIDSVFGDNFSENLVMQILYKEKIEPVIKAGSPDWTELEKRLGSQYGELAKERLVTARLVYAMEKGQWDDYGRLYKLHFEKTLPVNRNSLHINNMSWILFENINDTEILNFAAKVMSFSIDKYDGSDPYAFDTYANILYKLGHKNDAVNWEKKAVEISESKVEFTTTLEKMLNNEKTWK